MSRIESLPRVLGRKEAQFVECEVVFYTQKTGAARGNLRVFHPREDA
jgi:hypothetical protein